MQIVLLKKKKKTLEILKPKKKKSDLMSKIKQNGIVWAC